MIEIINSNNKVKMMAMVMGSIEYKSDKYVIYCIDRGNMDANIFVSKLVITSDGYMFSNDFDNGEKQVLDNVVRKIINKEDITSDGFVISKVDNLRDVNYFDVDKCYVSTISKKHIKDILIFYNLVSEKMFNRPVVDVVDEKRIFNEGYIGNIFLIVFGILVIVFSIIAVVGVFR